jgi:hypothetical protein
VGTNSISQIDEDNRYENEDEDDSYARQYGTKYGHGYKQDRYENGYEYYGYDGEKRKKQGYHSEIYIFYINYSDGEVGDDTYKKQTDIDYFAGIKEEVEEIISQSIESQDASSVYVKKTQVEDFAKDVMYFPKYVGEASSDDVQKVKAENEATTLSKERDGTIKKRDSSNGDVDLDVDIDGKAKSKKRDSSNVSKGDADVDVDVKSKKRDSSNVSKGDLDLDIDVKSKKRDSSDVNGKKPDLDVDIDGKHKKPDIDIDGKSKKRDSSDVSKAEDTHKSGIYFPKFVGNLDKDMKANIKKTNRK